jgi:hydroxyethylthiazole kinase-like uncharacterized protein yjeF
MSYIVNSSEMKRVDSFTIHNIGMPSMVLMERAALCVCEELFDGVFDLKRVVVICGSGNNGGDGFAIARLLHLKNIDVKILFAGEEKKCTDETLQQMKIAQNYGIDIFKEIELEYCTTIVDALFGIGLLRPIEGYLASQFRSKCSIS